ncbi:hypothetical protein [Leptolyngbya sp. 7M]|uniref:hypothetical protein n=1 Tax=Leptolyngbya sp. 7M TaxID=2812896 RepID=UPI001B8BFFAA|nr:hypothetical protein [Leptolyngbya sp. 7M]QYO62817.1 hypothetical protein JVX88_22710 [Leptolyngbya sp. 7M]
MAYQTQEVEQTKSGSTIANHREDCRADRLENQSVGSLHNQNLIQTDAGAKEKGGGYF